MREWLERELISAEREYEVQRMLAPWLRHEPRLWHAIGYLDAITNCLNEAAGMTENDNELERNNA